MTEKRFEIGHESIICDCADLEGVQSCVKCNGEFMTYGEIVKVLNEQHEHINTLRESRRELLSANNEYRMRETELAHELSALLDVNEQLKKEIKALNDFIVLEPIGDEE